MPNVNLLHFDRPYWVKAQHYIGYTKFTAEERIATHRNGNGSKLVAFALSHGCDCECVMVEHFDTCQAARAREKRLKRNGHLRDKCQICKKENLQCLAK